MRFRAPSPFALRRPRQRPRPRPPTAGSDDAPTYLESGDDILRRGGASFDLEGDLKVGRLLAASSAASDVAAALDPASAPADDGGRRLSRRRRLAGLSSPRSPRPSPWRPFCASDVGLTVRRTLRRLRRLAASRASTGFRAAKSGSTSFEAR